MELEGIDKFCGSLLWDADVTWNTTDPDFTPCFEKTVLLWIPCVFLWVFMPLELLYIVNSKTRDIPWNILNIAKLVVTGLLVILSCLDIAYAIYESNNSESVVTIYAVDYYTPLIKACTFVLCCILIALDRIRGLRTSGILFFFWFLLLLCGMIQYRTEIRQAVEDSIQDKMYFFVSYMVYYPLVIAAFLLNCFADKAPTISEYAVKDNPCPEGSSSFLSRLVFAWFDTMAWKGFRNPLETKDLWSMNAEDMSEEVVPIFEKYWKKSQLKAKTPKHTTNASFRKTSGSIDFASKTSTEKRQASIMPAICKAFGPAFLFGSILKLVQDVLTFVSPQILSLLIAFVQSDEPDWKGFLYAGVMLATACVQTIILSQYFHRMFMVGLRIRTALVSAIYRKALVMSNSARKESTVGEIVNLMSVDAQRFMDLTTYLNMIWSAPLQIALALYFLWNTLGPSVLAGLAVMIVLIPVNGVVANQVKKLQIKQMKYKDERVKLMNEVLSGIKVLKLYAWEPSFEQQILKIRDKEVKVLKQAAYLNAGTSFIWSCAPFLVSLVTFATYILATGNALTPEKAFVSLTLFNIIRMPLSVLPMLIISLVQVSLVSFATFVLSDERNVLDSKTAFVSLSLFNILRFPLSMLPMMISNMVQASVSIKRMNRYMNSDEIDPNNVSHNNSYKDPLVIENGNFTWAAEEPNVLKDINLSFKQGSLVAVVGSVGSGKSSLLAALLGEMEKVTGKVNTKGSIAYVPQQAWIQNATLQNNIVFGEEVDLTSYNRIIEACALKPDIDMLPGGDRTEIGEKGINLSGGQKQRVSLARAVYSNADVYFLDDPLSAVDSHVGKHIFENVIGPTGVLKKKTRVLVTHSITFLPDVDLIVVIKDGEVTETGTYRELLEMKGAFAEFLVQHLSEVSGEDTEVDLVEIKQQLESTMGAAELEQKLVRMRSKESDSDAGSTGRHSFSGSINRQQSVDSSVESSSLRRRSSDKATPPPKEKPVGEKLIEAEKAETGSVKWDVYSHYLRSIGLIFSVSTIVFNMIFQGFSIGSNLWLAVWSNDNSTETSARDMYLGVYGALGAGQAFSSFFCDLAPQLGCWTAARLMHLLMLRGILRAPLAFFDTTPVGRVIGRFSKDVDVLDIGMPQQVSDLIYCLFEVVATLFVISYSTPIFVVVIVPTGVLYYFIQRFYVATSRQLKRLESVSRSPIYSHFGESITGASTIRAYGVQTRFITESEDKVDFNQVCYYPSIVANRWLAVRLEMIGNLIIFFSALFAVLGRNTMDAGLVGLSVSYSLQITQTLNWLVRMTSDVETNIVAVERIKEYGETEQEAAWERPDNPVKPDWPPHGQVEFIDYQARYREGLELVLKGISFNVKGGEKVGIVGRTGAGKSSLTLGLFRIVEPAGGKIVIDNVDIGQLGLHALRSRLTIIPQDPVLFSGSLRGNLDPFSTHSDNDLWLALEHAHLKDFVKGLSAGLNHEVSEGGENLSVGQRQLICLARALLRKTKVLILDEATAAVDLETDDLIQTTIRTEFKNCTVLTIAHRLNTIMDSDRVIVLDKGLIKEFTTPSDLLKDKTSMFYGMAKDAGLI